MDLLKGYNSSSSSSSSCHQPRSISESNQASTNHQHIHGDVFTCGAQDALHENAAQHLFGVGSGGNSSSSKAGADGRLNNSSGRRPYTNKRRITQLKLDENPADDIVHVNIKGCQDGDGNLTVAVGSHVDKKAKMESSGVAITAERCHATKVVIVGCTQSDGGNCSDSRSKDILSNEPKFERSHPHWEGRWVGHLHFPFPPMDLLDEVQVDDNMSRFNSIKPSRVLHRENNGSISEGGSSCTSSNSSSSSRKESCSGSDDEEDGNASQSPTFLHTARTLIYHWARILKDTDSSVGGGCNHDVCATKDSATPCNDKASSSPLVIVPHLPMQPSQQKSCSLSSQQHNESKPGTPSLHISLARPIYLPSASVDPFLADIEKSITAVLSATNGRNNQSSQRMHSRGKMFYLQPHDATIFTNDEQSRSFLAIPVSKESTRWVKQLLLPPIDAAMSRFGLKTYYSDTEEGCILHVSVASVKGNVIPQMLHHRNEGTSNCGTESERTIRSIPLFSREELDQGHACIMKSLPRSISIGVNQIQCEFGKAKVLTIPF